MGQEKSFRILGPLWPWLSQGCMEANQARRIGPIERATSMRRMGFFLAFCAALAVFGPGITAISQDKEAASKKEKTQEIIAEGVGANADEALKDAYRNAVRQVVGAVVDAETLIKNDEIIDDKVLTYSDGFITGYEEVDGSKKVKSGLHRIKIKAQVERRSVIAKLKAANVTMKDVDGKGMFAEAVTQLDAEKDSAEMLKKQFEDFPQSCISATVVGKPEVVKKNADGATVRITVQIEPDLNAYKAFSARVIPIISKIASGKSQFTADFKKDGSSSVPCLNAVGRGRGVGDISLLSDWVPTAFDGQGSFPDLKLDVLTVAIAASRTKASDKIEFNVYRLDPSLHSVLAALASRRGKGNLSLLDASGDTIASDSFDLFAGNGRGNDFAFAGTMISAFGTPDGIRSHVYEMGLTTLRQRHETDIESAQKNSHLFIVSPTFFATRTNSLEQLPSFSIPVDLNLSLDELKSAQDAKVEINFQE